MGFIFIIGLLFWGWAEISAFIFMSNAVGGLLTLFGVFLTAIIGIAFLKNQGLSVLNRVRNDLAKGHPPIMPIADSISLVIGGGLMVIPGYLTDSFGLLLCIPGFRTMAGMYLLRWAATKPRFNGFVNFGVGNFTREKGRQDPFQFSEQPCHSDDFDNIIEGEFEERPEAKTILKQKKSALHDDC